MGAIYSRKDVCEFLGIGLSTLKKWERQNPALQPDYKLSEKCVRYSEGTVKRLLEQAKQEAKSA
jgi:predicted site-specific integrase-resolvase